MGVILDSSVLIAAERQGQNARQMLSAMVRKTGDTEIALSVITLLELAHGVARAETRERQLKREQFIQEHIAALPIYPVTTTLDLTLVHPSRPPPTTGTRLPLA